VRPNVRRRGPASVEGLGGVRDFFSAATTEFLIYLRVGRGSVINVSSLVAQWVLQLAGGRGTFQGSHAPGRNRTSARGLGS
jgi:hypothetical protein